jgi:uncharacterized protein (TIGR01244 family)
MARSFPLLALLLAAPLFAQAPESVDPAAIPNYHRIRPDLAGGGQPSAEALAQLKAMGFKTVINLRTEREGAKAEQEAVEKAGLRYVWVPMTAESFSASDVSRVASVVDDESAAPVLLHCASANRVGAMWAALEAAKGKPLDEAEAAGRAVGLTSPALVEAFRRVSGGPKP